MTGIGRPSDTFSIRPDGAPLSRRNSVEAEFVKKGVLRSIT